jgi:Flp pilus assembly pilin Flp
MVANKKMNAKRRGQGMTEYVIIVALIAIAAIAVVTLFGNNLRDIFGTSASALAGTTAATTGATTATVTSHDLKNFANGAQ